MTMPSRSFYTDILKDLELVFQYLLNVGTVWVLAGASSQDDFLNYLILCYLTSLRNILKTDLVPLNEFFDNLGLHLRVNYKLIVLS